MSREPVGSITEEAAKLIAAIQGLASTGAASPDDIPDRPDAHDHDAHDHQTHRHDVHDAADPPLSAECRFCPLCQLARLAKATSPEVRDHLTSAALSLTLAVKALLEGTTPDRAERPGPVEKIDLTED